MAGGLMFMQPDELMTLFGTVAGGAATGYDDDHLVDGRPGRPVKEPGGSPSGVAWVITGSASKEVGAVVVANHNLDAGLAIAVTGGVSASLVAPAAQPNGIALNAWDEVTTVTSTNTLTVTIGANSVAILVGEVLAGKLRDLESGILLGAQVTYVESAELPDGKFSSLPGYDDGVEQRSIACDVLCWTSADKDTLEAWWRATRGDTRPSVLIPFPSLNDAWVGHLTNFRATYGADGLWHVSFTFLEYPRSRW